MRFVKPIADWFASTAWPLTIVFFVLFFRRELKGLLSHLGAVIQRIGKDPVDIAIGEKFKVHFGEEMKKVGEEAGRLPPPGSQGPPALARRGDDAPPPTSTVPQLPPPPLPPSFYRDRLYKLADISPRAAILDAWREVELGLEEVAVWCGLRGLPSAEFGGTRAAQPPLMPAVLARRLFEVNQIDPDTFRVLEDLRQLRNQASHAIHFQPTDESAREYVRVALDVTQRIKTSMEGALKYSNGTEVKVGHVVMERGPERYLVIGRMEGFVHTLAIGTVQKEGSPSFGETIILPQGYTRSVPASVLTRIGSARITIVDHDPVI